MVDRGMARDGYRGGYLDRLVGPATVDSYDCPGRSLPRGGDTLWDCAGESLAGGDAPVARMAMAYGYGQPA